MTSSQAKIFWENYYANTPPEKIKEQRKKAANTRKKKNIVWHSPHAIYDLNFQSNLTGH